VGKASVIVSQEGGNSISVRQLMAEDVDAAYNILHVHSESGAIANVSWYEVSVILSLYGNICFGLEEDRHLVAISLNLPMMDRKAIFAFLFSVEEEKVGQDFGRQLLKSVLENLKTLGWEAIQLRVLDHNKIARKFWRQAGFVEIPVPDWLEQKDSQATERLLERSL
jgi:GNAT superfamily N-acetyltransferase